MKNKIIVIVLIVLFVAGLVLASIFINKVSYGEKDEEAEIIINTNSKISDVNEENFEAEVLNSTKRVLIDFYADWCGPCQMLSPLVDEVASENPDYKFVRIDVDTNENLANKYEILYLPTLVLIENGEEIARSIGYIEKDAIEELVKTGNLALGE